MDKAYKFSIETREKMRIAKLGKKRGPQSKEWIEKRSEGIKRAYKEGRMFAQATRSEVKEKIARTLKLKGIPTPETKAKMLASIPRGENHWRWKNGLVREQRHSEMGRYEYSQWRESVFKRDNYTCQHCGATNGDGETVKLNAHHIQRWKDSVELRYNINNGITLCLECHIDHHRNKVNQI